VTATEADYALLSELMWTASCTKGQIPVGLRIA